MSRHLDVDRGRELAADMLRELTPHAGDSDQVDAVLTGYLDRLGHNHFSLVCMAAVQMTFTDCLTLTPLDSLPDERLALLPPHRQEAS